SGRRPGPWTAGSQVVRKRRWPRFSSLRRSDECSTALSNSAARWAFPRTCPLRGSSPRCGPSGFTTGRLRCTGCHWRAAPFARQRNRCGVPDDLPVLEALHSTPSRRYLAPDPIPEAVLWAILDAAIRGPSGGNSQQWGWVVVTDEETKNRVAGWYRENWDAAYGRRRDEILGATAGEPGLTPRGFLGAEHLAYHLEEAPVWVFPVLRSAA